MNIRSKAVLQFFSGIMKRISIMFYDALDNNDMEKMFLLHTISNFSTKELTEFVERNFQVSFGKNTVLIIPIASRYHVYSREYPIASIGFWELFDQAHYRTKEKFFKKNIESIKTDSFIWPDSGKELYLTTLVTTDFLSVDELNSAIGKFIATKNQRAKSLCHLLPEVFDHQILVEGERITGVVPILLPDSTVGVQQRVLQYSKNSQYRFQNIETHVGSYTMPVFTQVYVLTDRPLVAMPAV